MMFKDLRTGLGFFVLNALKLNKYKDDNYSYIVDLTCSLFIGRIAAYDFFNE
jgi:hypothetical protein